MLPTQIGLAHDPWPLLNSWSGAATAAVQSKAQNGTLRLAVLQRSSRAFVGHYHHRPQTKVGNMAAAAVSPSASQFSIPPHKDSGRPGTLLEALEHLQKTREDGEELPEEYTVSEEERPAIRHDEWSEMGEIPVIDLSQAETDRAGVVRQLHSAATEWGFFQLVNHGFSVDELDELQAEGREFFELPAEIKQKLGASSKEGRAYIGDNTSEKGSALHWAESLMFRPVQMDETLGKSWHDGYSEFKDVVTRFSNRADIINKQLMELLAEGLGLPVYFFSQHLNSRRTMALRWNFYPACPRPSDVLGASSHTDGCSITLLIQDKVGGLQILKDGKWLGIKPIEGALVVNIGDTLHAWSNGLFKSVLHRAVVNESVHRLSLAAFVNVDYELPISAPDELVDESHPRLYRPFTSFDYTSYILRTRYMSQSASPNKDGLLVLDSFRLKE